MKAPDPRQLRAVGSLAALAALLRLIPGVSVAAAGSAGWLCGLAALPLLLGYGAALCRAGGGLADRLGPVARGALGLWFLFYGGFLLRAGSERFFAALGIFTGWKPFALGLLALAIPMAAGGRKPLARAAQVFLPVVTGILLLTAGCALPLIRWDTLKPVWLGDVPAILRGALPVAGVGAAAMLAAALLSPPEKSAAAGISLYVSLTASLVSAMAVGVLGPALTTHLSHPFFILLRNLSLSPAIERIEALIAAMWVLPDAMMLSLLLLLGRELLPKPLPVWILALGTLAAAALLSPTAFGLTGWSETIIPICSGAVVLAVPLIAALRRESRR